MVIFKVSHSISRTDRFTSVQYKIYLPEFTKMLEINNLKHEADIAVYNWGYKNQNMNAILRVGIRKYLTENKTFQDDMSRIHGSICMSVMMFRIYASIYMYIIICR